jgi:uncharacterized protein YaeQ
MALSATVYNLTVELSDIDRGVYEALDLRIARHPSESAEYMLMRLLAYCLEYEEGIDLTQGVSAGDDPAVWIRDMTGKVTAWIEVGAPDADRLHRGMKLAGRAAVYTHRDLRQFLPQLVAKKIHRADEIPIYAFDPRLIEELAALVDRRTTISLSITERQLYVDIAGKTFNTTIAEHRIPA